MQALVTPAIIGAVAVAAASAIYKYLLPEKFSYERVAAPYISSQNPEEIKTKLDPKNMRHYWYPVCYSTEITKDNVKGIHLLGEPLCLYRDKTGRITCVLDRCPHRSAPLSIGKKLSNGNLECVYHGWQFSTNGAVERIPAVSKNSTMPSMIQAVPKPVHEELGYIWIWPGPVELAHPDFIPRSILKETGQKGWATMTEDGMDLNCEHGLMVDNLLDNAHVDFTHDKTIGNRNLASAIKPREVTDSEYSNEYPGSFTVEFTFPESTHKTRKVQTPTFTFIPPCFIRLSTPVNEAKTYRLTQVMLCIPSSKTKMRLMYRFFTNFLPAWLTKIPIVKKRILKQGRGIVAQDFELLDGITKNLKHGAPVVGNIVGGDMAIKKYREWREASESHVDPWFNCSWGGNSCRKEHIVKKSSTAASTTSESVNDIEDLL